MDAVAKAASNVPPSASAPTSPPAATSDAMTTFRSLSATVLDTSGKYTDDERLQAYNQVFKMTVMGQLKGVGDSGEDNKLYNQVIGGSDISQRANQLQQQWANGAVAALKSGGPAAAGKAMLGTYDSLSKTDQDILFQQGINPVDRTGSTRYADVQSWRDNVNAQVMMSTYMQASGAVNGQGVLDQGAAVAIATSDPKFAAAAKLALAKDNTSATWTQMVMQLFREPEDRVDLSDNAKKVVNDAAGARNQLTAYREGAVASKTI